MTDQTINPTRFRGRYTNELSENDFGAEVAIAGWVHEIRKLGGIAFILLRDRFGIVQVTAIKKELGNDKFKELTELPKESVIAVKGTVQPNEQVSKGFEILPQEFEILGQANSPLPLGVADEAKAELETKLDTRLNNRYIDLRKPEIAAIFKIRATFLGAIREQLEAEGFIEINTPKIVATATEGGTELFKVDYFGQDAFLNQSPQLFKQIMMASGLDRIYEIGPAFRAEEHDTVRHINEFTSIDIEMAFADEEDAMGVLERAIHHSIQKLNTENQPELEILGTELPKTKLPYPRVEYSKCIEIAEARGVTVPPNEDFSMEATKAIAEELQDFYFITRWPTVIKPFYAQPFEDDPNYCRGFDLNYAEKEITSGAQRVHNIELLTTRLREQNLNPDDFEFYLKAFEYGMPPHAGWGLGTERTIMIFTGMENIRECILFPRDKKRLVP